jgi:hypothetical protein
MTSSQFEAIKNRLLSEIRFLEKEFLAPLRKLELPYKSIKPTDFTEIVLGTLPVSMIELFCDLAEKNGN